MCRTDARKGDSMGRTTPAVSQRFFDHIAERVRELSGRPDNPEQLSVDRSTYILTSWLVRAAVVRGHQE
jgi:hypothetical protein